MSNTKHTLEPWELGYENDTGSFDEYFIEWFTAGPGRFNTKADAERCLSCVNACVGMEDPNNEIAQLRAELDQVKQQRNELLDALRNTTVHLIAAHSLLEHGPKTAAASDKIFDAMLNDYAASIEVGRIAIANATNV